MIWKQEASLEIMNEVQKKTMGDHLGIRFIEIGDDFIKATMPVDHRTKQPAGLLHGGASVALAETLGSVASFLCLEDMVNSSVVGIEVNANHLRSAKTGEVVGTVKPLKIGRRVHVWNILIHQEERLLCSSRLTVAVIKKI